MHMFESTATNKLTFALTLAWCLFFVSHVGHTLLPAWADTHTQTATFRALGYTMVRATAPTTIFTSCEDRSETPAATTRIHGLKAVVLRLYYL